MDTVNKGLYTYNEKIASATHLHARKKKTNVIQFRIFKIKSLHQPRIVCLHLCVGFKIKLLI